MARIDLHQLDEFNNQFVTNVEHGDVPVWDANTNNGEFKPVPFQGVFGTEFYTYYDDTEVSTTSDVYQDYFDITTPSLPAGDYLLLVQVVWRTSNARSLLELRLLKDTVELFDIHQVESSASTDVLVRKYVNGEGVFTQASDGTVQFQLQYRRQSAVGSLYVFSAYLRLFRIS